MFARPPGLGFASQGEIFDGRTAQTEEARRVEPGRQGAERAPQTGSGWQAIVLDRGRNRVAQPCARVLKRTS